jgi:hypothetical protein
VEAVTVGVFPPGGSGRSGRTEGSAGNATRAPSGPILQTGMSPGSQSQRAAPHAPSWPSRHSAPVFGHMLHTNAPVSASELHPAKPALKPGQMGL